MLVGLYDALHEMVAHDILFAELHHADTLYAVEHVEGLHEA